MDQDRSDKSQTSKNAEKVSNETFDFMASLSIKRRGSKTMSPVMCSLCRGMVPGQRVKS